MELLSSAYSLIPKPARMIWEGLPFSLPNEKSTRQCRQIMLPHMIMHRICKAAKNEEALLA